MTQEEWAIRSQWLDEDNAYQDEMYRQTIERDAHYLEGRIAGIIEAAAIVECIAPTSVPATPRAAYQQAIDAAVGFLKSHAANIGDDRK